MTYYAGQYNMPNSIRSEGADTARAKQDCGPSDTDSEERQRRQYFR